MIARPSGSDKTKSLGAQSVAKRNGSIRIPPAYECVGLLGHPVVRHRTITRQTRTSPAVIPAIAAMISDEKTGRPNGEASHVAMGAAKTAARKGRQSNRRSFAWVEW